MAYPSGNGHVDHYQVLQIRPDAEPAVVKAAYRALIKIHHPDRGGDTRLADRLNAAYAVISDSEQRQVYDRERNNLTGVIVGAGRYRLLEPIAEGGFGRTYKAEHLGLGGLVCIKHCAKISADHAAILKAEAKTVFGLRHFAIPAVHDFFLMDDGSAALVMDYIPGPTLMQIIEKSGRLIPEHVAWITERVLRALLYLHQHGVLHGDLKPQNVIVQPKMHMAVIIDYGLSQVKPTRTSAPLGYTPVFAPPEEIAGKPLVPESDLYSLGMTMIYALSGSLEMVHEKKIPQDTPEPIKEFIYSLIRQNIFDRASWRKSDLVEDWATLRSQVFGRTHSGMMPIPGFENSDV